MRTVAPISRLLVGVAVVLLGASCTGTGSVTFSPAPTPTTAVTPPPPSPTPAPTLTTAPTPTTAPSPTPAPTPTPTRPATATPPPFPPTASPIPTPAPTVRAVVCVKDPTLDAFATGLLADLAARDEKRLAARMSNGFEFVVEATDVAIPPMTARAAASAFVDGLAEPFRGYRPLVRGSSIDCEPSVTPEKLSPGNWILKGKYAAAFLTTGWGPGGDEEAFVYLERRSDGTPYWRGVWYSLAGFRS
jgi:hypothetical protein